MSRIAKAAPTLLLSVLGVTATLELGACGSSDSSGDTKDAGGDGPPIWTAPGAIVSVSPAENDDNVSVHAPIQITYNEPVTVTATSVTLSGPNSAVIATTASLSEDRKTVIVTPVSAMPTGSKVTLAINDIRTAKDGAAAQTKTWSWTVPTWLRVGEVFKTNDGGSFNYPALATGPGEKISVASNDGSAMVIRTVDTYLGKWARLGGSLNGGRSTNLPSLVVDKTGALIASFVDGESGRLQRWSGSEWTALNDLGRLGPTLYALMRLPGMAIDSSGKLYVVHGSQPSSDSASQVLVKSYANGVWASEGPPVLETTESFSNLGIALDKRGVPYVYYENGQNLYVSLLSPDKQWRSVGGAVNPPNERANSRAAIAVDDTERPFLFTCFGSRQIRSWDGRNWQTVGTPMPGDCDVGGTHLARTRDSHFFAFWTEAASPASKIRAADVANSTWTPVELPATLTPYVNARSLAVDAEGNPVIAWQDGDDLHVAKLNR